MHNNSVIQDPNILVNMFASHFNLSDNAMGVIDMNSLCVDTVPQTFFMEPTTPHEIVLIIKQFEPKYSAGIDNVPPCIIKEISEHICVPLANLINDCIEEGVFPDLLKIAKIIPVQKRVIRGILETIDLFHCCLFFQRFLKRLSIPD